MSLYYRWFCWRRLSLSIRLKITLDHCSRGPIQTIFRESDSSSTSSFFLKGFFFPFNPNSFNRPFSITDVFVNIWQLFLYQCRLKFSCSNFPRNIIYSCIMLNRLHCRGSPLNSSIYNNKNCLQFVIPYVNNCLWLLEMNEFQNRSIWKQKLDTFSSSPTNCIPN